MRAISMALRFLLAAAHLANVALVPLLCHAVGGMMLLV